MGFTPDRGEPRGRVRGAGLMEEEEEEEEDCREWECVEGWEFKGVVSK